MGYDSYIELDRIERSVFEHKLLQYLIEHTQVDLSISCLIKDKDQLLADPALKLVFEGNGFCVFERR